MLNELHYKLNYLLYDTKNAVFDSKLAGKLKVIFFSIELKEYVNKLTGGTWP